MNKEIRILTHTDFDGAVFPYLISELSEKYLLKKAISIEYCDINNIGRIMQKDFIKFENYSDTQLKNIYYLVHDVANIGDADKIIPAIAKMKKRGLNFSYIDHHYSENNKKLNDKLDCVFYTDDNSMCASMMGYSVLLNSFKDAGKVKDMYDFLEGLQIRGENASILNKNIEKLYGSSNNMKALYQQKFFTDLFEISEGDIHDCRVKNILGRGIGFVKGADYLDRGMVEQMPGLALIRDYFNFSIEHSPVSLETILSNIKHVLSVGLEDPVWNQVKNITDDLSEKYKPHERVKEANKNVDFIKVYGESGKKYNIAVFFAGGDIRYDIERNRRKMDEVFKSLEMESFNVDAIITATRFTIGHTPIMTLRRVNGEIDILEMAQDTFKQKDLICGTNAGIPIEYPKKMYDALSQNSNYIAKYKKNMSMQHLVLDEKMKMKKTLRGMLHPIFNFEVIEPKKLRMPVIEF